MPTVPQSTLPTRQTEILRPQESFQQVVQSFCSQYQAGCSIIPNRLAEQLKNSRIMSHSESTDQNADLYQHFKNHLKSVDIYNSSLYDHMRSQSDGKNILRVLRTELKNEFGISNTQAHQQVSSQHQPLEAHAYQHKHPNQSLENQQSLLIEEIHQLNQQKQQTEQTLNTLKNTYLTEIQEAETLLASLQSTIKETSTSAQAFQPAQTTERPKSLKNAQTQTHPLSSAEELSEVFVSNDGYAFKVLHEDICAVTGYLQILSSNDWNNKDELGAIHCKLLNREELQLLIDFHKGFAPKNIQLAQRVQSLVPCNALATYVEAINTLQNIVCDLKNYNHYHRQSISKDPRNDIHTLDLLKNLHSILNLKAFLPKAIFDDAQRHISTIMNELLVYETSNLHMIPSKNWQSAEMSDNRLDNVLDSLHMLIKQVLIPNENPEIRSEPSVWLEALENALLSAKSPHLTYEEASCCFFQNIMDTAELSKNILSRPQIHSIFQLIDQQNNQPLYVKRLQKDFFQSLENKSTAQDAGLQLLKKYIITDTACNFSLQNQGFHNQQSIGQIRFNALDKLSNILESTLSRL